MTSRLRFPAPIAVGGAAFVLLIVGTLTGVAKQPKIVFRHDVWDFGRVKQGETLTHEFVFRNEGTAPLTIKSVETSCGCTTAPVSDKILDPGKEGKILATFNTAGYSGAVTKYIFVESDDPENPRVELAIKADVLVPPQPRIDLEPFTRDVGVLVEGEEVEASVVIKNRGERELVVEGAHKNASFSSGGKPVSFPLRVAAGREVKLDIKIALPNRAGLLREFVAFKSNDPNRPSMSFSLNGYIITQNELKELFSKYKKLLQ